MNEMNARTHTRLVIALSFAVFLIGAAMVMGGVLLTGREIANSEVVMLMPLLPMLVWFVIVRPKCAKCSARMHLDPFSPGSTYVWSCKHCGSTEDTGVSSGGSGN